MTTSVEKLVIKSLISLVFKAFKEGRQSFLFATTDIAWDQSETKKELEELQDKMK